MEKKTQQLCNNTTGEVNNRYKPSIAFISPLENELRIAVNLTGKGKGRMDPYGRHHSASSVCVKVVCKVTWADAT